MTHCRDAGWQGHRLAPVPALFSNPSATSLMDVLPSVSLAAREPRHCHGDGQIWPTLNPIDAISGLECQQNGSQKTRAEPMEGQTF